MVGHKDNFPEQYNAQKIPEWFQNYIDYHSLAKRLHDFHTMESERKLQKLPGTYYFSAQLKKLVYLNFQTKKNRE